jgi:WD40 repeat protein
VVAATLSPDGRTAAIAVNHDRTIRTRLVDARTGRILAELDERGIRSLGFSPDGSLLATGSADRTARLWDARSGRLRQTLPHRGHVLSERFSTDGSLLVTGSDDGAARVWSVSTGERQLLLVGATGVTDDASFGPNGAEVVVASSDRSARIYSTADGSLIATLAGHRDTVTSAGYDASGRTIVTASTDGTARLWSAGGGNELIAIDHYHQPVRVAFAGNDVLTVAGSDVWKLVPQRRRVEVGIGPITAFAARGDTLLTAVRRTIFHAGAPIGLAEPVVQLRLSSLPSSV